VELLCSNQERGQRRGNYTVLFHQSLTYNLDIFSIKDLRWRTGVKSNGHILNFSLTVSYFAAKAFPHSCQGAVIVPFGDSRFLDGSKIYHNNPD
jgi:hypothetical protein